MNIPKHVVTLGLAGCLCSIFLHAAVPSMIHAATDMQTTQRHSLIVRPPAATTFATTENDGIAKRGVQRLKRLSLVDSALVQKEPRMTRQTSLNQLIPVGTQLPASLATNQVTQSASVSAQAFSTTRPPTGKVFPAPPSTMQSYEYQPHGR